jgi:hypothetical protein
VDGRISPQAFADKMNAKLPEGVRIISAEETS